jgi:hypothetical protein
MIRNRETEAEARVEPGWPAAQKAIDKSAAGFVRSSVTKHETGFVQNYFIF